MKKALSVFLSLVIAFGVFAGVPFTENAFDFLKIKANAASESDLTFVINQEKWFCTVVDCNESATGELVIPSDYNGYPVTSIGKGAFANCSEIEKVYIPDTITEIANGAFYGMSSLKEYVVDGSNGFYLTEEGVLFNLDKSVLVSYPICKEDTSYIIPDTVNYIGDYAFYHSEYISSITIPESVVTIGKGAFWGLWGLRDIEIPYGVVKIGDDAFTNCINLTSVDIPDSVTRIGDSAFDLCTGLVEVLLSENLMYIGEKAFYNCTSLTDVIIPDSVISIDDNAFAFCTKLDLESIPDSVVFVGENICRGTLSYNDENNWVNDAFYIRNHLLETRETLSGDFIVPQGTLTIAAAAFQNRENITSVIVPSGVAYIGNDAFNNCPLLASITISDTVEYIGEGAFDNTAYYNNQSNWAGETLCIDNHLIKVTYTSEFYNVDYPIRTIAGGAFKDCIDLRYLTIENSVSGIGENAFYGCENLVNVMGCVSVRYIGDQAFYDCDQLENVACFRNTMIIGDYAFYGCKKLLVAPTTEALHSIGDYAFYDCDWLKFINIGCNVGYVGEYAIDAMGAAVSLSFMVNGICYNGINLRFGKLYYNYYSDLLDELVSKNAIRLEKEQIINDDNGELITLYPGVDVICDDLPAWLGIYEDYVYITTGTDTVQLIAYVGNGENITVPSQVETSNLLEFLGNHYTDTMVPPDQFCSVTSIGSAFGYYTEPEEDTMVENYCSNIVSITLPETLQKIDSIAFLSCVNLTTVTFQSNITKIGNYAFYNCCMLEDISIPFSVTEIGDCAFELCSSLVEIDLRSVNEIGVYAFSGCEILETVKLSSNISLIKDFAFYGDRNIRDVYYYGTEEQWENVDVFIGNEYLLNATVNFEDPDSVEHTFVNNICVKCGVQEFVFDVDENGMATITGYNGTNPEIVIPARIGDVVIHGISPDTFMDNNFITSVTISEGIEFIGNGAFRGCVALESVVIPDSIVSIYSDAFAYCSVLTSVSIGSGLKNIGSFAFDLCQNIREVNVSDLSVWCSIEFGDGVSNPLNYGSGLYLDGELITDLVIPDDITIVNEKAFSYYQHLISITVHGDVSDIGDFYGSESLVSFSVAEDNETYSSQDGVLFNKDKTRLMVYPQNKTDASYNVPYGVEQIDIGAFSSCNNLTSVKIPDSVKRIGNSAFRQSSKLTTITVPDSVEKVGSYAFDYTGYYNDTNNWTDNLLYINNHLVSSKYIKGPLIVRDGTKTIADYAFYSNSGITSVECPGSLVSIGNHAFSSCENIKSVTLSNGLKAISSSAFADCSKLMSITIPESVKLIDTMAFYRCSNLSAVEILGEEVQIGAWAFGDCSNLETVVFSGGIKEIDAWAFDGCSISSITFPEYVESVHIWAFDDDANITYVFYEGTQEQWDQIDFESDCTWFENSYIHYETIDHIYGDWKETVSATCEADGEKYRVCSVCPVDETQTVPALGHDFSEEWTTDVQATCTEEGSKSHHCSRCDEKIDVTVVPSIEHDFICIEALSEHPHKTTYECSNCHTTKTEDVKSDNCIVCGFEITEIDMSSYKLVSYSGSFTVIKIPAKINNCDVTTIANGCFKNNQTIVSVEIPIGMTTIGALAFMNCSGLESVYIPDTVTSIGSQAFYGFTGKIYCYKDSVAHQYAVENNIAYQIIGMYSTEETVIDYDNKLIFTSSFMCEEISDMVSVCSTSLVLPIASQVVGNTELLGTGTEVSVFNDNDYEGDYKVIVIGDINGDSVCDVLDAFDAERASNGHISTTTEQIYAANGCISDELDVSSYQNVVNMALKSN